MGRQYKKGCKQGGRVDIRIRRTDVKVCMCLPLPFDVNDHLIYMILILLFLFSLESRITKACGGNGSQNHSTIISIPPSLPSRLKMLSSYKHGMYRDNVLLGQ